MVLNNKKNRKICTVSFFLIFILGMLVSIPFGLAAEDSEAPINPSIQFSTYLGGSGDEMHKNTLDLAQIRTCNDSDGNIIIVGRSKSDDFPLANPIQSERSGGSDIVISKISANGSTLLFSSYLGGIADDWATDVAIDADNNILIVGTSASDDFPLVEPYQNENLGGYLSNLDIVIIKISGTTYDLLFSTYLGGSQDDWGYGIAVDEEGEFSITGSTMSTDFPVKNAYQSSNRGTVEAYITKFSADGQEIRFSTYIGGSQQDWGTDLVIDSQNNIIFTGGSRSTNYPIFHALQSSLNGSDEIIIGKFDPTGILIFSTFYGTSTDDIAKSISITPLDEIIVIGTCSTCNLSKEGAIHVDMHGSLQDVLFIQLSADGQFLTASGIFGGLNNEIGYSAIWHRNYIYITGIAQNCEAFPLKRNMNDFNKLNDIWLLILDTTHDFELVYSDVFGTDLDDSGRSICFTGSYRPFILGFCNSAEFNATSGVQTEKLGSIDMDMVGIGLYINPSNFQENDDSTTPSIENNSIQTNPSMVLLLSFSMIAIIGYFSHGKIKLK